MNIQQATDHEQDVKTCGRTTSTFFLNRSSAAQLRRKKLCNPTRCRKEAFEGLTNPRNTVEYKHDAPPWVIVAEHRASYAAPTSHGKPPTSHPPTGPKQAAATGHRCQTQTIEEQPRLPITNQHLAPAEAGPSRDPTFGGGGHSVSSLPSHVTNEAALTSQSKTGLHAPTTMKI